jgi:hypothetical protein
VETGYRLLMASRWETFTTGPMGGSLRTHPVNVAVRKGQRVADPADAPLAVAEARWLAHRTLWLAGVYLIVGLTVLGTSIANGLWWGNVLGIGLIGNAMASLWQRRRTLWAISLNQAPFDPASAVEDR